MADDRFIPRLRSGLSGAWDENAEAWHFDGAPPGPAGLATTVLVEGIEVDVDVAEPHQIVGLWLPDVGGDARAQQLAEAVESATDAIGRLALAEDVLAGTLNPSDVAVALATIDRALASREVPHLLDAGSLAERVAAAVNAAHTNVDGLMASARPDLVADALRDLIDQRGAGGELDALVRALEDAGRERFHGARLAAAPGSAPPRQEAADLAPISHLLDIVDLDALPEGLRPDQVAARATTRCELEVRVYVSPPSGTWWVRAHHDGTVVAAAPIQPSDGGGVARILVPPAHLHHLELDITSRPGDPRPSWTYRAVGRAVRSGRRAASHRRAERDAEAERRWRECGRAWEEAGDTPRMRAAMGYSRENFPRNLGSPSLELLSRGSWSGGSLSRGPLLSDHVAE